MSDDYKRGYGKGYSTGCRRSDAALEAERKRADAAAIRAERAESVTSIGHCEECQHWKQGDHASNWQVCAWGTCHAGRQAGTPWGAYAINHRGQPIQTSPRFGCVLFLPKPPEGAT